MSDLRKNLFGSAAAFAVLVAAPSAAFAFDEVEWAWHKKVDEQVDIDIDINAEFDPSGMTEIEKLQIQIGDVKASSVVHGIDNNRPDDGAGVGTFSETFTFTTDTVENLAAPDDIMADGPQSQNGINANFDGGTLDESAIGPNGMGDLTSLTFTVDGTVITPPGGALDAELELPTVESTATAVGNNQSIVSEVPTYLHDAQILFDVDCDGYRGEGYGGKGGKGKDCEVDPLNFDDDGLGGLAAVGGALVTGGNTHTAIAAVGAILAINGTIEKADISAKSEVYDILNARVDSVATAVGNNTSVDVNPNGNPDDSILIADLTQLSVADVTARSHVYDVSINNYSNLNAVNPIISSSATAVGNNVSINVGKVN